MSVSNRIGLVMVMVLMGLLGSGCPQYRAYQAEARQAEAETSLGAVFVSEIAFFGEHDRYGLTFAEISWAPEPGHVYAYFLADDVIQPEQGGPYSLPAGVKTYVNEEGFQAVAVANLDDDAQLDVWAVNQDKELVHVRDDAGKQEGGR